MHTCTGAFRCMLTRTRKFDHISPVLQRLHWLPIRYRIHFKILLLTWKALHDMAPAYISELINLHNPSRQLRSSHKNLLSVPRTFSSHGDRAFYSCAPKLWNSLPADLRFCSSLDIFKKTLKTPFLWFYCFSCNSIYYYCCHIMFHVFAPRNRLV